ncbi:competence protein CoiA [Neobacillus niacini]|uniref:competence protein CoiA n=1 Tax=Neobacillus niacini TaxID=86668 RepID=UPI003982EBE9
MLTAKTRLGKIISLGNNYKKENLLVLRDTEKFSCPVCGEAVSLKLGNQRIYHFAHRSGTICKDFYESETIYHMEGKLQLFHWLKRQQIQAELEYYDPIIGQRPDVMFYYEGNKYALEYQCSPITEEIFIKRTNAYCQHNYIPLWIIGGKHIKAKRSNIFSLSNFQYFFIRETKDRQLILPSYCPEEKQFHILSSIIPYSVKNTLANHFQSFIQDTRVDEVLTPNWKVHSNFSKWTNENERNTMNWSLHPTTDQSRFLREIYQHNLNLYLLPPEIGLPVYHSLLIQTPGIIWQTYLYLDSLEDKWPNDFIDLKDVERNFNYRIKTNEITIRALPQLTGVSSFFAVKEYFLELEKLGLVTKRSETMYQLQNRIYIPKSNREKEERRKEFLQKYKSILAKI